MILNITASQSTSERLNHVQEGRNNLIQNKDICAPIKEVVLAALDYADASRKKRIAG